MWSIKHPFQSPKSDGADPTQIQPSNWNAAHTIDGPLGGFQNRILNGNFIVNERAYVSGVARAAGVYAHDRWKAGASGCTYTFGAVKPDVTITITSGSLLQIIEDVNVEGGSYMVSWAGTATGRVGHSGAAPAGAYSASPIAITGAAAGQQVTVEFTGGTLSMVQVEPGTIVSPFERRFFPFELSQCQRYFEAGTAQQRSNGTGVGGSGYYHPFKVKKRIAPSAIAFTGASYPYGCSTIAAAPFIDGFEVYVAATAAYAFFANWSADVDL